MEHQVCTIRDVCTSSTATLVTSTPYSSVIQSSSVFADFVLCVERRVLYPGKILKSLKKPKLHSKLLHPNLWQEIHGTEQQGLPKYTDVQPLIFIGNHEAS